MQTYLLLCVIVALTFFIFLAGSVQMVKNQQHNELSDRAALCSAYYQYADDTHKKINEVDKMCWRTTDSPVDEAPRSSPQDLSRENN